MALSLAKAAPLKPEIKLAQALSEFEAILSDDQKTRLRTYRGQPPDSTDVMRFTAEIDRDAGRNRKSRQCVGPRLTNVLHAVQQFSTAVDSIVGGSQSQMAGAIWGTVKISLYLASTISSYFDQLSTLFMRIGLTCPRNQEIGLLYPESRRLQNALCEYFVVIVHLCKQAVLFLRKPFWSQLSSSVLKPFESEFGSFQKSLENLATTIRDEVSLASNQAQQSEAKDMSTFRKIFSNISTHDLEESRARKRKKAKLRFLNACSVYNHEKSWKRARKEGNSYWLCHDKGYKQWKEEKVSSTLWCTGILGSGKTVLSANVVEDLKITTSATVAYFFCKHDEAESLKSRTIMGSIARQIFDHIQSDLVDANAVMNLGATLDIDQILDYLHELLPKDIHKYFIIIDGLDECSEIEATLLLQYLKQLLMSIHVFQVYCSSRPDVSRWAHTLLEPNWNMSMAQTSIDIDEYIEDTLVKHLESGKLSVGDSTIILTIQDALIKNAHGMFLWVVFQIDSICSEETDTAILAALKSLPKDLPETFNRILQRRLHDSNGAGLLFRRIIFDLMAAAQRPLTLEELREAISVNPGEISWDAGNLVNDMLRLLLDSCGSLVAVDEEALTVHFTHHSVKQHLLSDISTYQIIMKEADLRLGDVIVTYLNFGVFDQQLAKARSPILPQGNICPTALLGDNLSGSSIANRLAVKILKRRQNLRLDIHGQLQTAARILDGIKSEQTQPAYHFLHYAQEYWLYHTKGFTPERVLVNLWERLIDNEVQTIKLPWAPKKWNDFGNEYIEWILQNEHWALINRSLVKLAESPPFHGSAPEALLEFLEKKTTNKNARNINFDAALYLASFLNNKPVVLLSRIWANVNAQSGRFGTALQAASRRGHEEIVRLLLRNGADVNAEGGTYGTALQSASAEGHEEIARFLLTEGADVNAKGGEYGTALQAASFHGHKEMVRFLLESGADVNAKSGKYGATLHAASFHGHTEIAELLLKNGADVNAEVGEYGTALRAASYYGHEEIAQLLLENGADVNAGRKYGTALQAASEVGHEEMARFLLENGADINAEGGYYGTALQAAVIYGYEEMAKLLLENGADVTAEVGQYGSALEAASYHGREEMVRLLLKREAALQAASFHGPKDVAGLLLENGADVNTGRKYGTALLAASYHGHNGVARLLLENGVDIETEGYYGTSLVAASRGGHEEMVRLLLKGGSDVNARNGEYGTALQAASFHGHKEIAGMLLENGADVNAEGCFYGSALQAASFQGHKEIAGWLLEYGADVNAEGGKHGTALQASSREGHEEIVRLLQAHGADVNAGS